MEERERMLDTIMEMQKCNVLKDKQIETLDQENQKLKDRWQKLKENIKHYAQQPRVRNGRAFAIVHQHILDKMQELEKEE